MARVPRYSRGRRAPPNWTRWSALDDYGDYIFHGLLFAIVALAILERGPDVRALSKARVRSATGARSQPGRDRNSGLHRRRLSSHLVSGLVGMTAGFAGTWLFFRDGLDLSFMFDSELTFSGLVFDPVMVPAFSFWDTSPRVSLFMLVIGVAASLYPAIHASHLDPAEAVKWEG